MIEPKLKVQISSPVRVRVEVARTGPKSIRHTIYVPLLALGDVIEIEAPPNQDTVTTPEAQIVDNLMRRFLGN